MVKSMLEFEEIDIFQKVVLPDNFCWLSVGSGRWYPKWIPLAKKKCSSSSNCPEPSVCIIILRSQKGDVVIHRFGQQLWGSRGRICWLLLYAAVHLSYLAVHSAPSALMRWQSVRESLLSKALINLTSLCFCFRLVGDSGFGLEARTARACGRMLRQSHGCTVSSSDSGSWLSPQPGEQGSCSYLSCLASCELVHGLSFDFQGPEVQSYLGT